jgi:PAS domain S-box-containing protein
MSDRDFETSSRRLAAIVESSDDAIISKDLDGTIRSWNRGAEQLFGYTLAETIGCSIRLIIPADRQSEEDHVLASIRAGNKVDHFETIRRRKDGSLVPISLTVSPIRNAEGVIVGASKVARDLTDKRRAERLLADAREAQVDLQRRLMMLVAASGSLLISPRLEDVLPATLNLATQLLTPDACAVWRFQPLDQTWRIESSQGVSDRFAAEILAAYQDAPVAAVPLTELLIVENVSDAAALGDRRQGYVDEGIVAMMAVPLRIGADLSGALVLYYRAPHHFSDVEVETTRALGNLASAALTTAELYDTQRRSREQSDFLAEVASILASSLDYENTLTRVAELAVPQVADWCTVDLLSESGETVRLAVAHVDPAKVEQARRFHERFPEDPIWKHGIRDVIRTGAPLLVPELTSEMLEAGADSAEYLAAVRELGITSYICVPLTARGRILGALTFVATAPDRKYTVTDLRVAESVAWRAALAVDNARAYEEVRRANQLKDDFLATFSHELRTPLNAILGYARMLKSGMVADDRLSRAFDILYRNATSLTQLVEDVLNVARIVAGKIQLKMERVELPPLVSAAVETVQPAAEAKGVRLMTVVDPRPATVMGDPDRLQQVLWNVLSNAVKFTPGGGRVEVALERTDGHAEIVVSDTGIGIAPAFLPHIFERFRQGDSRFAREFGGLGLGLAIARHLIEMHGGTISATSEGAGKGATFRVLLPVIATVAVASPRRDETERAGSPRRLDSVHVLVVDDEDDALIMVRELLESAGARVTTATSADDALELLAADTPDLLLSDIGMPNMDGFEFIRRVRQLRSSSRDVPAAALTAYVRSEDRERAFASGFQAHLTKPIDPDELLSAVHSLAGHQPIGKS